MRSIIGTSLTLALVATSACGGDDSTNIQLPGDSGGADTLTADGGNKPDTGGNDSGNQPDTMIPDSGIVPDAGTFTVKNVLGLALWLDGTKGITQNNGFVSRWADQSGNVNDAFEQNVNFQPKFNAGAINNEPALHFKASAGGGGNGYGNMLVIADAPTLDWNTGDYLIEVVAQYDNNPNNPTSTIGVGTFYSKQEYIQQPPFLNAGPDLYGNWPAQNGNTTSFGSSSDNANSVVSANTGFNDGKPRVFTVQRVGTALNLRVDGVQTDSKMIASINVDKKVNARIGASGDASWLRLDGDIAEIIAVKGAITSNDLAGIEDYLKTKYGL